MATWSYSGDPSNSSLDEVRFLIGDTDEDHQLLWDEEIIFVTDQYTNAYWAAGVLANTLAARFAPTTEEKLGDWSGAYQQRYDHFLQLSKDMKEMAIRQAKPFFGGVEPLEDEKCTPKQIKVGMWSDKTW
jgi:hypothetical protein